MELRSLLKVATPGSTIFLIEAVYDGNFVIEGKNITLIGKGDKSILSNSGADSFVVKGTGHRILSLKIIKSEEHVGFNCLRVDGDMNSFSDVTLIGGACCAVVNGIDNPFYRLNISVTTFSLALVERRSNSLRSHSF